MFWFWNPRRATSETTKFSNFMYANACSNLTGLTGGTARNPIMLPATRNQVDIAAIAKTGANPQQT